MTSPRILFITATRIGDAVLSCGLLDWLARSYPDARITVACGPGAAPLFEANPNVERILPMRKRRRAGHWRVLWQSVRGIRWDLVVDLRRSLIPWLVRTRRRATLPHPEPSQHRVALIARTLGLDPPPAPRVWLNDDDRARAEEILQGADPVLAVAPTANWAAKIWPPERFADLVERLTGIGGPLEGGKVFVTGGPGEEVLAQPMIDAVAPERLIARIGLDLRTTAAVFRKCRLFVGNDSGLMHLSAAAGAPTLGLFGPTRDENYAPWGEHCRVVRTPESVSDLVDVPGFDHRRAGSLMGGLTVDTVEARARELLSDVTRLAGNDGRPVR